MFRKKPAPPMLPPTWVVVGLGNPGPEYANTRHNVGFDVIDLIAERAKVKLATRRHRAVYGIVQIGDAVAVLAKPLTYMNLSGQAVAPILREFQLKPDQLLVVTDDLDLPLGKIRIRANGSAGGHNGHKSIIASLGTQEYARIKIGIGKSGETVDHVLSKFHPDERATAREALEKSVEGVHAVLNRGLVPAMNQFNGG